MKASKRIIKQLKKQFVIANVELKCTDQNDKQERADLEGIIADLCYLFDNYNGENCPNCRTMQQK